MGRFDTACEVGSSEGLPETDGVTISVGLQYPHLTQITINLGKQTIHNNKNKQTQPGIGTGKQTKNKCCTEFDEENKREKEQKDEKGTM